MDIKYLNIIFESIHLRSIWRALTKLFSYLGPP